MAEIEWCCIKRLATKEAAMAKVMAPRYGITRRRYFCQMTFWTECLTKKFGSLSFKPVKKPPKHRNAATAKRA